MPASDDVGVGAVDLQRCGDAAHRPELPATTPSTRRGPVTLPPLLLEVLVCPECKSSVTVDASGSELACDDCGLVYPVRDGIPIMLISAARRPDDERALEADDAADDLSEAEVAEASDDDAPLAEPTDD
jgi:uncharacterized protein YbaR (Trm112 family)